MNIQELIEHLSEIAINSPKAEVRIATQPSWPFENSIKGLVVWNKKAWLDAEVELIRQSIEGSGEEPMSHKEMVDMANHNLNDEGSEHDVVYLEEGSQIGYLPEGPRGELGW